MRSSFYVDVVDSVTFRSSTQGERLTVVMGVAEGAKELCVFATYNARDTRKDGAQKFFAKDDRAGARRYFNEMKRKAKENGWKESEPK